jgi:hypothetical protein
VAETPPPPPVERAPAPAGIVVPSGTRIFVRTVDPIDSKASRIGQEFVAILTAAVTVKGMEAFHADDVAHLRLGEAARDGHPGKAELALELVSISTRGQSYAVKSSPFAIKSGFLRKKKVSPGSLLDFTLTAPASIAAPPS